MPERQTYVHDAEQAPTTNSGAHLLHLENLLKETKNTNMKGLLAKKISRTRAWIKRTHGEGQG